MNRPLMRAVRRIGVVAAGVLLAMVGAVAVATPAQAAPIGCYGPAAGHYEVAGSYITAYRYWLCDNGEDIPLSVSIQRYLSPGVFQTVASGTGETTYYCEGMLYNQYRTTGTSLFAILCT